MRAVVLTSFGEASKVLQYTTDHPKPVRKQGEVLIAVHATSINPGEWRVRQGSLPTFMITIPQILGCDVAGVVLDADASSKFKPGDHVFGCTGQAITDPWGTYAELCSTKEAMITHIPPGVSSEQAAGLPVAGMTAWQALAPSMPLQGKRVFVHGGSGGIGHIAVQVAKAQGAYVATTCSGRNTDFCTKELGADLAVDYTKVDGAFSLDQAGGEPYDVVLDLVGAEPQSWGLLRKRTGRMVAVSWDKMLVGRSGGSLVLTMLWSIMSRKLCSVLGLCQRYDVVFQEYGADKGLLQLAQLMSEGEAKVHVERVMALEEVPEAHAYAEQGRTRGKLVIKMAR